jgi:hypothetical protein
LNFEATQWSLPCDETNLASLLVAGDLLVSIFSAGAVEGDGAVLGGVVVCAKAVESIRPLAAVAIRSFLTISVLRFLKMYGNPSVLGCVTRNRPSRSGVAGSRIGVIMRSIAARRR